VAIIIGPAPSTMLRMVPLPRVAGEEKQCVLAARLRPRFALRTTKTKKAPDPIPSDSRRRWYRLYLDRAWRIKNQEGETPTDA
jgi:hypothetical protein